MPTKIEWCQEINSQLIKRFWSYVEKTRYCWNWRGGLFQNGYGQFRVGKWKVRAHRFSWVINGGYIFSDHCILHHCDNPICVRPDHLWLGTHKDNAIDRGRKNRTALNNLKPQLGKNNGSSKIDETTVKNIRYLREYYGFSFSMLGIIANISPSQIANIVHRRAWRHI